MIWAYGLDFDALDEYISRSKIILNLHMSEPYNRQEQIRMFYPLINGKCIISEKSQYNYYGDMIFEYDGTPALVNGIREVIDSGKWKSVVSESKSLFLNTSDDEIYKEYITNHEEKINVTS
jgi:hypothetical protein